MILRNAGFAVRIFSDGVVASLESRKIARAEVAYVLDCEDDDLKTSARGVLIPTHPNWTRTREKMTKRNQKGQDSENKEYVAVTISRHRLRSEFGDEVADKMTDEKLKGFVARLNDFYWSCAEDWKWILSESYGIAFDD